MNNKEITYYIDNILIFTKVKLIQNRDLLKQKHFNLIFLKIIFQLKEQKHHFMKH